MATSAVPTVINYLVTTFTAASTLGAAATPVAVRTGPALTGDFNPLTLWVGIDDPTPVDNTPVGAQSDQTWAGTGANPINENLTVFCCAEAWSGDTNTLTALTSVYSIVAAVDDLLRRDRNLGGNVLMCGQPSTGHSLEWHQGEGGAAARVRFQITATARIGGA